MKFYEALEHLCCWVVWTRYSLQARGMHFELFLTAKPSGSESVMGATGRLALGWCAVGALFFLRYEISTREPFQPYAS